MEQNALRRQMWEDSGKAGLVLGLISTAYLFLTQFMSTLQMPAFAVMIINTVLWAGKFGGCIWFMMYFMKGYAERNTNADNSSTFRFGMITALLSALIYSAASFANIAFISADMMAEQMDVLMQQMAPMMDSNTMAQMDKMMDKLPQITFFSNLIYCFFYGTILSFILSRNIPDRNPFAGKASDEW